MPLDNRRARHLSAALASLRVQDQTFRPVADAAVSRFRSEREALLARVRSGDLTARQAQEQARALADLARGELLTATRAVRDRPPADLARAARGALAAKAAERPDPAETTNGLLRKLIDEVTIANRQSAYHAETLEADPMGGRPVQSTALVMATVERADEAGDGPKAEWARRALESLRGRVAEPAELHKLDVLITRPGEVTAAAVTDFAARLKAASPADRLRALDRLVETGDASGQAAVYLLTRDSEDPDARGRLRGALPRFAPAALEAVDAWEADAEKAAYDAAAAFASLANEQLEAQTRLPAVHVTTEHERLGAERAARSGFGAGIRASVAEHAAANADGGH